MGSVCLATFSLVIASAFTAILICRNIPQEPFDLEKTFAGLVAPVNASTGHALGDFLLRVIVVLLRAAIICMLLATRKNGIGLAIAIITVPGPVVLSATCGWFEALIPYADRLFAILEAWLRSLFHVG